MMTATPPRPLKVFISYAHEDDKLCEEFVKYLSQLRHDSLIEDWHDRRLTGGSEWEGQIDEHLDTADIVVLLVSQDFLNSRYCYDVEMKRALDRHKQRKTRVVPVILKPCDWKTAPFAKAKLVALPKDGLPVEDWKSLDHGFLNVAEGLRAVAAELRGDTRRESMPAERIFREVRRPRWMIPAAAALVVIAAGWFWWSKQQEYLAQGDEYLNVGRYAAARAPYEQAQRLNPLRGRASLGIEKVKLADLRRDPVAFEQRLGQLRKESPRDSHLKVLEGDYLLTQNKVKEAMRQYQDAVKLNPALAEAYFRMGVLYSRQRNSRMALEMFKSAADRSPLSPQYLDNLADQYFKRGEYDPAIAEYKKLDQFPLAALELAKIYRLKGELDTARERESLAIEWLESDTVMARPENEWPWALELGEKQGVTITDRKQKLCYARLELSATLYLQGKDGPAAEQSKLARQACGSQTLDVKAVVDWELSSVADEADLAAKVQAYRRAVLGPWGAD